MVSSDIDLSLIHISLASIIARRTDMRLHKLNGTTASTADIKAVVEEVDTLAGVGGILPVSYTHLGRNISDILYIGEVE